MIKKIINEIYAIKERNKRVEIDKAWETSLTRKIFIIIFTYIVIVIFFISAELPKPFINAIVPSLAFFISTLSLPIIKKIWVRYKK
jgi:peptidoglycan/LPS O-acetylase OafA/YrhL